jgi:hypothetical protein
MKLRNILFCGFSLLFVASVVGAPGDYKDQANELVSAEELNLIYAFIPQNKGDKFLVLSSHRVSNIHKYYVVKRKSLVEKPHYFIVSTSPQGLKVYYQGQDKPFVNGVVPVLNDLIPDDIIQRLAMYDS